MSAAPEARGLTSPDDDALGIETMRRIVRARPAGQPLDGASRVELDDPCLSIFPPVLVLLH